MNYGYASLSEKDGIFLKEEKANPWVHSVQLYHHCVISLSQISSLKDKTMLEVGSGRGGGLMHVFKTLNPKHAYGVDLSPGNIDFCREAYKNQKNVTFIEGNSTQL